MTLTTFRALSLEGLLLLFALPGCASPIEPGVQFRAEPNPIPACKGDPGQTTLVWYVEAFREIEIRVNEPDGSLLTHSISHGSVKTGPWVNPGTRFFLVDRESRRILSRLEVGLAEVECPAETGPGPDH